MKLLLMICLFAGSLLAQRGTYTVERKSALVASSEAITVQLPIAATATSALMMKAAIYCSVECEITLERDGTEATATALTPVPLQNTFETVSATAYRSSNVGVGSVIARYTVAAGLTLPLDLVDIGLMKESAPENFTIRTASITGTVIIVIKWREY